MSALFDLLLPELQRQFPGRGMKLVSGTPQSIVFPSIHPEVGDIIIYDDVEELTVLFGEFTHCHYGEVDSKTQAGATEAVAGVIEDLDALFSDRLRMWGHRGSGGVIHARGEDDEVTLWESGDRVYVWSGPVQDAD